MDDILNDCIERLVNGETVEDCLASYPEQRAELASLLEVSAATIVVADTVTIRPEAKQRGLYALTAALADRGREPERGRWLQVWRNKLARSAVIALGIGVLATGTAFGASVASEDSLPGDALYAVKTLKEDISLRMPKSDVDRAKQHAHLANVRTQEIGQLVDRGRYDDAREMVVQITYHLNRSAQIVGVTVTAISNPLEPSPGIGPDVRAQDAAELASYVERDAERFQSRLERQMLLMAAQERELLRYLMWQWEMRYRAYVLSLAYDGSPP